MRKALSDWHLVAGGAVLAVVLGASFPHPVLNEPDQPAWRARYSHDSYPAASYAFVDRGPIEAIPGPIWDGRYGHTPPYDMHPATFAPAWPQTVPEPPRLNLPDVPSARELTRSTEQAAPGPEPQAEDPRGPVADEGVEQQADVPPVADVTVTTPS